MIEAAPVVPDTTEQEMKIELEEKLRKQKQKSKERKKYECTGTWIGKIKRRFFDTKSGSKKILKKNRRFILPIVQFFIELK